MGACSSKEPAVAESHENTAASPPASREPEKNKSLLPETQSEPAKQLKPTSEPPPKRDEEEEDEGLSYDRSPIEEVCVFVRALFSDIFVTRGDDFLVFFLRLYALVLVSTLQNLWPACRRKNFNLFARPRHEEECHEDPQVEAVSRFIIANSGEDEGVSTFQEESEQKAGAVSSTSRASGVLFFSWLEMKASWRSIGRHLAPRVLRCNFLRTLRVPSVGRTHKRTNTETFVLLLLTL